MSKACDRAGAVARRHPYIVGGGIAIAVTAGIGFAGLSTGAGPFANIGQEWRLRRKFGNRGVVENGMLKEAIGMWLCTKPSSTGAFSQAAKRFQTGPPRRWDKLTLQLFSLPHPPRRSSFR